MINLNPHVLLADEAQAAAVESLTRVDEGGYLYHMDCAYDYYQLPEAFLKVLDAGCSTFFTPNLAGEHILCRNYDYSHFLHNDRHNPRTGVNVVVAAASPAARYRSLGVADAFWLDYQHGSYANGCLDDGETDVSAMVLAPYVCMDGINEAGLGVSVMALSVNADWEEVPYAEWESRVQYGIDPLVLEGTGEVPPRDWARVGEDSLAVNHADRRAWVAHCEMWRSTMPGKRTVLPPVMMRMMLDTCATVEEALALADTLNITATGPGSGYHIQVVDESGASKLLEWEGGGMNVVDVCHATNYRLTADDGFHGVCGRDECIKAGLARFKNGMREDYVRTLLGLVAQEPNNGADRGKTQYSCIYNLERRSVEVFSFGDFTRSWNFSL